MVRSLTLPPVRSVARPLAVRVLAYGRARSRLTDLELVTKASAALLTATFVGLPSLLTMWTLHSAFAIDHWGLAAAAVAAAAAGAAALVGLCRRLEQRIAQALRPTRSAARDALLRFSLDLVKLPRPDDLAEQLTRTVRESLDARGVALYLRGPSPDTLAVAYVSGDLQAPALLTHAAVTGASGTATGDGGPSSRTTAFHLCIPVRAGTTWLGAIALDAKRCGAPIDDSEVTLLSVLSTQLAVALKNADYVRQIEQQKAAIEGLQKRLEAENVCLRAEVHCASQFQGIVGSSVALQRVLTLVEKLAPSDASVLITGETGTGKELIARALHEASPRRNGPLINVNCPAIPRGLAETELFGHERGAFTDAREARPGKFELADGGTIFLDEVADLPLDVQVKLLRVLQERETQRVGSHTVQRLDLRVIAATNRDLHAEMRAHRFREDLYYRLAAVVVPLPSLRERVDDIAMLATYFLTRAAATHQSRVKGFTPEAMAVLRRYSWPGNIRELQNVIERAVMLCPSEVVRPEYLADLAAADGWSRPFGSNIREEKRRRVQHALAQTGGNRAAAARLLGISPSNLARLIKSLQAKPELAVQ